MEEFSARTAAMDALLGVERCFDMTGRDLTIGGRRARLWVVNGYGDDAVLERMIAGWLTLALPAGELTAEAFLRRYVSVCDASAVEDRDQAAQAVFAGKTLLLLDGVEGGILLDAKRLPMRGVEEPDTSKVLRGSHDGFVESVMENAALLRRRIRDPHLTLEKVSVGTRSRPDIVLAYMKGTADPHLVAELRRKLENIDVGSLTMGQESIAEAIECPQWYNPFPKVRYTERPDVAAASLMEGSVLVMLDNTPAVMLLPVSLFRFAEETNDFYFPPLIGTYLRLVRLGVILLNIFITPLWFLLVKNPEHLPSALGFLEIREEIYVPLLGQLLLVEFIIDVLKLASLNTPNTLSNSFSMLGALILGDFAVQSRWLVPEVLVYMAFVAVAGYTQHSYEMSYAFKLCRMALLVLIGLFDWWGFGFGCAGVLVLLATTKPLAGKGYLDPLIPFRPRALAALLHRRSIRRGST